MLKTAKELIGGAGNQINPIPMTSPLGDIDLKALDTLMKKHDFKKKPLPGGLAYYEWESDETFIYAGVSERKPGIIYIAFEDKKQNNFEEMKLINTTELDRFLSRNKKKFK